MRKERKRREGERTEHLSDSGILCFTVFHDIITCSSHFTNGSILQETGVRFAYNVWWYWFHCTSEDTWSNSMSYVYWFPVHQLALAPFFTVSRDTYYQGRPQEVRGPTCTKVCRIERGPARCYTFSLKIWKFTGVMYIIERQTKIPIHVV